MLIAKNVEETVIQYLSPIEVLGQNVYCQFMLGPITINIPKTSISTWTHNSVNLQILQLPKGLKDESKETRNYFAQMISANTLTRPTIMVLHQEDEYGYVIDRVQQSFIVHADAISESSVYLWGSACPEMYNNDLPLVRIFSTNAKTHTIKEVRYYADSLEPKTYYTEIGDKRYDQLNSLRKDHIFIINHNGARFEQRFILKPFMRLVVSSDYVARMEKRCHGNEIKLIDWYFHSGLPENISADMIHCVPDNIDAIKQEIEQHSDYSTTKGPKWVFIGFGYEIVAEARAYAQSFSERSKHHEKRYVKLGTKQQACRNSPTLTIPAPPEEAMQHYADKNQRRDRRKNKRLYETQQ